MADILTMASWHSLFVNNAQTDPPSSSAPSPTPVSELDVVLHVQAGSHPTLAVDGRVVTWRALILTAMVLLVLMCASAAAVAWWAWRHLAARVVLTEQQADIRLPQALQVRAKVSQSLQIQVDQVLPVRVPIHQDVSIPLLDAIPVRVSIDTTLPLNLDVPVRHTLHVDQVMDVDTKVQTRILGFNVTLPVKGKVPIKADVPIDLVIPVRQRLPVALVAPAMVRLIEPLRTRIDTVIEAKVPIHEALSLPLTAPVDALLTFPQQHVQAGLNLMDLTVPFQAVTLVPRAKALP